MGDRHSAENQKKDFCARVPCAPSVPCPAGSTVDYIEVCKPAWAAVMFGQRNSRSALGAIWKKYEAHHILCYSPVSGTMFADSDQCKAIIKGTKWCVNNAKNMVGLPLWGHTVAWYLATNLPAPFMNLPNHDRDHNPDYTDEVRTELKKVVNEVQVQKDEHNEVGPADIAGRLNGLSELFAAKLVTRGNRSARGADGTKFVGTHACFQLAQKEPSSEWYLPFSMAKDPAPRDFPSVWAKKRDAIQLAEKLLGGH